MLNQDDAEELWLEVGDRVGVTSEKMNASKMCTAPWKC